MNHIMLDLETMAVSPRALVLSIGAVRFDPHGDDIGDEFYITLSRDEQAELKREVSAETVRWWDQQSNEAKRVFREPQNSLAPSLKGFIDFCTLPSWLADLRVPAPVSGLWGNGSDFDNVVVTTLLNDCGVVPPWRYSKNRCFRTLKNLFPNVPEPKRVGTHHNALDDAKHQARWAQGIYRSLRLGA